MEALVVYDVEKLPPAVRELVDPGRPLPPGAQFFEERYTFALLAQRLFWGLVLIPVGVVVAAVSFWLSWHLDRYSASYDGMSSTFATMLVIGLLLLLFGIMLLASLRRTYRTVRQQDRGIATRYGVLLVGDVMIYHEDDATKVVPKSAYKGVNKEREVQFEQGGNVRSFKLPAELVGRDPPSLDAAVARWAA